jgi:UDP-2-acetamido-2-deoxy-ribo-hexuluronate aminotransferase
MPIPFVDLKAQYALIRDDIHERIDRVLDHGKYILGPEVSEFEEKLGKLTGAKHVVGVSNGSDSLLIALMAWEVGPGDAVFLPSFTYTATAEVVLLLGATPVFIEVDADTFNLSIPALKAGISECQKTEDLTPKVILPVDLFGLPADYSAINSIATENGLHVLADSAQSMGGAVGNHKVGSLATANSTSFFPAKPLGAYGDGGALLTSDDELAERYRSIRFHGRGEGKYDVVRVGLNARLDTLQAAILLSKLDIFEQEIIARNDVAKHYSARLSGHVVTPDIPKGVTSAWAQYTLRLNNRDIVAANLKEKGIPTAVYYPLPMHLQPAYMKFGSGAGSLPISERLSTEVLSLPMHPYLQTDDIDKICDAILEANGT